MRKIFFDDFLSFVQNTVKTSVFEMKVDSLQPIQLLKTRWILKTRGYELFIDDIRYGKFKSF